MSDADERGLIGMLEAMLRARTIQSYKIEATASSSSTPGVERTLVVKLVPAGWAELAVGFADDDEPKRCAVHSYYGCPICNDPDNP